MNYTKPPLSITDQIAKLKERELHFEDEIRFAHHLSNIRYYRLRAYTYPFQDNTKPEHEFIQKVSFEEIISLYVFDRQLRLLVFNAIEKIEISLRTKIIYEFALTYGKEENRIFLHIFLNSGIVILLIFYQQGTRAFCLSVFRVDPISNFCLPGIFCLLCFTQNGIKNFL